MYRLLHIITDTNIGGAGVLLLCQLKYFDRTKFDIGVVLPRESELIPRVKALGYEVIESRRGADSSFEMTAIGEYVRIIKKYRSDIVHCHGALSARIAALICGVPVRIHTRHCAYPPRAAMRRPPVSWITGWLNNTLSSGIVAVAEAAVEDLTALGTHFDKIRVIINGAEPLKKLSDDERRAARMALGFSDNDFVVGIFARLEQCKGHKYLFEAVAKMGKESRIKILLCGRGSLADELRRLAASLDILDRVVFAGFCPDISPYMNAVDLNVNCSVGTETSSLALSEGMSLGRAAVVSDYGGNGAMVENGVSGVVVPRANVEALAAVLSELENDRELLESMGAAARRRYDERFTPQRMTHELENFYLEQLESVNAKRKNAVKKSEHKTKPASHFLKMRR